HTHTHTHTLTHTHTHKICEKLIVVECGVEQQPWEHFADNQARSKQKVSVIMAQPCSLPMPSLSAHHRPCRPSPSSLHPPFFLPMCPPACLFLCQQKAFFSPSSLSLSLTLSHALSLH